MLGPTVQGTQSTIRTREKLAARRPLTVEEPNDSCEIVRHRVTVGVGSSVIRRRAIAPQLPIVLGRAVLGGPEHVIVVVTLLVDLLRFVRCADFFDGTSL